MITNDRQLSLTRAEAAKLKAALQKFQSGAEIPEDVDPVLVNASLDAMASEIERLEQDIAAYLELQASPPDVLFDGTIEHLPLSLIKARIARRWTQRDLAEQLGLKDQQIQRYEADEYAGASLTRLIEVANALNLEVSIRATSRSAENLKRPVAKVITKKARPASATTAKRSAKKAPAQSRAKPTRSGAKPPRSRTSPEAKSG